MLRPAVSSLPPGWQRLGKRQQNPCNIAEDRLEFEAEISHSPFWPWWRTALHCLLHWALRACFAARKRSLYLQIPRSAPRASRHCSRTKSRTQEYRRFWCGMGYV